MSLKAALRPALLVYMGEAADQARGIFLRRRL
jgi:hypothetical protein